MAAVLILVQACSPGDAQRLVGPGPGGTDAAALVRVSVVPRSAQLMLGDSLALVTWGHFGNGDSIVVPAVTYSATGGTITTGGLYIAGTTPGTYRVIATSGATVDTAKVAVVARSAELVFVGDFENGFSGWNISEGCCSYSHTIVQSPVRAGTSAARIELRRTDPQVALGPRSELIAYAGSIPTDERTPVGGIGDEVWYGLSIYLPAAWIDDTLPEIVHQEHEQPDVELGETWRSPPFAIVVQGTNWQVWSRWDTAALTVGGFPVPPSGGQALLWSGTTAKGRWTDWVVHARWSYQPDGLLEVWKDGMQIVHSSGPNAYNDIRSLYLKIGVYKWPWKAAPLPTDPTSRVIYYDEVRIARGPAGYAAVAP